MSCATAGRRSSWPWPASCTPTPGDLRDAFETLHEERYGYHDPEQVLELVTLRVSASLPGTEVALRDDTLETAELRARARRAAGHRDGEHDHPAQPARRPRARDRRARGPCVIELPESTLLVPPGWSGEVDDTGTIHIRICRLMDAIDLQVLTGALHAICEEMGAVLIRSAHSANIKERRDASTALFTPQGEMVMQAEHIPVHLGAMPAAVASVLGEDQAPERSWILNDPYRGGTHLPDITVITPVFAADELIAFAANRAHHADVGGPTPGSMPADSTTLDDEGVVIEPRVLDESAIDGDRRRDAASRPAPGRSARPAGRRPNGRPPPVRAATTASASTPSPRPTARFSTTPSGAPGPASPSSTTAGAPPRTSSRPVRATCRSS